MGEFKKGDVIRAKRDINGFFDKGANYRIAKKIGQNFVLTDNDEPELKDAKHHTNLSWLIENFELVTLKIEAGKFYKTRDGRKVGPMVEDKWHDRRYGWTVAHVFNAEYGKAWRGDGAFHPDVGTQHGADLIAEWIDEPAAKASNDNTTPKFKAGDRISGNAPAWGMVTGTITAFDNSSPTQAYMIRDDKSGHTMWVDNYSIKPATPTAISIVALIENGLPKPSSTPHVHTSAGAAEKEAKRLAAKYKGQQFGVFTLTTTHEEAAPVYDHKWQNMAYLGLKIDAIKELRAVAGLTLKGAKDAVEAWIEYESAA